MTEIDEFTLFCVECRIKELMIQNKEYQDIAKEEQNNLEFLIFENRRLVLIEALTVIKNLSKTRIEQYKKLKKELLD